jgi:hypothetical protein
MKIAELVIFCQSSGFTCLKSGVTIFPLDLKTDGLAQRNILR